MAILSEKAMEDSLIAQLTCGESQWALRSDITTEDALWNNFRSKLNKANISELNGILITDKEMDDIKEFIRDKGSDPYKAALWLSGERGVVQIPLLREDASLGKISLVALNNREIAGGNSSYEVIRQYRSDKEDNADRDRRFDVTLLINGMPLIHIELKNQDHPYMDAFRQIKKYSEEGKFSGIFGLVQMFVVSNGSDSRYIAAAKYYDLNEKFLTSWVDEDNKPVDNYLDFAKEVLNVPRAHEIVGRYSVLDDVSKRLILLRPYQIHAIEKVKEASRKRISGFVWHTTGSGKTLTSYNVTRNLLDIPSIDKVLFLIDRRDLDKQTTDSFKAYAANSSVDVDDTENTYALRKRLNSNDREVIITTVQKVQSLLRWCERRADDDQDMIDAAPGFNLVKGLPLSEEEKARRAKEDKAREKFKERLKSLQVAFVVDECHRAVSTATQRTIERFFDKPARPSLWYGFTGTPLFAENKSTAKGSLPKITRDQYGDCLHQYTIKEAIKDKAVLGFQITYQGRGREELYVLAKRLEIKNYEKLTDSDLEHEVETKYESRNDKTLYDSEEDQGHKRRVVKYLFDKCKFKLGLTNVQSGHAYEAMLTCRSIADAQEYYELIKEYKEHYQSDAFERVKEVAPDFPKFAITYTVGENEDGATANQKKMQVSLDDYNKMFGTTYTLAELNAYNRNLNDRLARKQSKYKERKEQLDLVIVVDRLLTGFDAPSMGLLIMDRPPMSPQNLVQAMSRTNRIFDKDKAYGQIVTMQSSFQFSKKIDEALLLYSRGGSNEVSAPTYAQLKQKLKDAINHLMVIAPTPEDFEISENTDPKLLRDYVLTMQRIDGTLAALKTYDEFDPEDEKLIKQEFGQDPLKLLDSHKGKYQNALEVIRHIKNPPGPVDPPEPLPPFDLDYELSAVKVIEVSYQYLFELIQRFVPQDQDLEVKKPDAAEVAKIERLIEMASEHNIKFSEIIKDEWFNFKEHPEAYANQNFAEVVGQVAKRKLNAKVEEFAQKWGISPKLIVHLALSNGSAQSVDLDFDYETYKARGGTLNKLKAKHEARAKLNEFLDEEVRPLLQQGQYKGPQTAES